MKSITKIIIGLLGIEVIGLLTYYIVKKEKTPYVIEKKPITNPSHDTVVIAKVIKDTIVDTIKQEFSIDGEEFTLTNVEGVYTNSTKDKMLIIKENIWKKMIRKVQKKFPNIGKDCNYKYEKPELSEYKFVGLLTYFAASKNNKITTAYSAIEIRKGHAKYFAGGEVCCGCEGVPLEVQQVDAVIVK